MKTIENKVVFITGSTDGIGKQTAFELAKRGAALLLHGRNSQKCEATIQNMRSRAEEENLEFRPACYRADLSSLEEVRAMAERIKSDHAALDILVNNAGIGPGPRGEMKRQTSRDGHELRFAVNFLAPFLLTNLLLPALRNSFSARVVNVASAAQKPLNFENIMLENGYSGQKAYAQSKLAMVMFTLELAERLKDDGITVNSLHPGSLLDTKMVRETGMTPRGNIQAGADSEVYLAASNELAGVTGKYFEQKTEALADRQAYDRNARKKLWRFAEKLVGL